MATKREVNGNVKFFNIAPNGKFGIYSKEKTDVTTEFTSTNGKVKNFEIFDSIDGKIESIYHSQEDITFNGNTETVDRLVLRLRNSEQTEILTCSIFDAKGLIVRLENLDFSKEMVLKAFKVKNDNGKMVQHLIPYQDGNKIKTNYSKDGKKLPMGKKITVGKKEVWDYSEYEQALINIVDNFQVKSVYNDEK
jgi:hypothetical protein